MTERETDSPATAGPATGQGAEETQAGHVRAGRRGKGYFLPGFIALVALLGIGLFVGAGDLQHPAATTISGPDLASQVALGIQAQQNLPAPPPVTCPKQEPVRQGLRFVCTLGSRPAQPVYVTETDNRGRVRWSLTAP